MRGSASTVTGRPERSKGRFPLLESQSGSRRSAGEFLLDQVGDLRFDQLLQATEFVISDCAHLHTWPAAA